MNRIETMSVNGQRESGYDHKRITVFMTKELPDYWANTFYYCPYCRAEVIGGYNYFDNKKGDGVCPSCGERLWDSEDYKLQLTPDLKRSLLPNGSRNINIRDLNTSYHYYCDLDSSQLNVVVMSSQEAQKAISSGSNFLEIDSIKIDVDPIFDRYGPFDVHQPLVNNAFKYMRLKRQQGKRGNVGELIAFAERQIINSPSINVEAVKNNTEKLKNYIKNIIDIEAAIYSCKCRLETLYDTRIIIIDDKEIQNLVWKEKAGLSEREQIQSAQKQLTDIISGKIPTPFKAPIKPNAPVKPTMKQAGLFNKKKVQAENEYAQKIYDLDYRRYESALEKYNVDIEEHKKKESEWIKAQKEKAEKKYNHAVEALQNATKYPYEEIDLAKEKLINQEIDKAEEILKKLIKAKNELYSLNIVFGKYHDFVAVSSFYEYLASGRCASLEGPNGAYNIYESELRANQIINQLSEIINSLEQIKKNQYVIYSELQKVTAELDALNASTYSALNIMDNMQNNLTTMANNSQVIAYNTEQTAYYAKKNVELTDALGFLVALN